MKKLLISLIWCGLSLCGGYAQNSYSWEVADGKYVGVKLPWKEAGKTELNKEETKVNILHKSHFHEGKLSIHPLVAFQRGQKYTLWVDGQVALQFQVPASNDSPAKVSAIYPETDTLPANLLRLSVIFDQQMSEALPYPFVHLVDEQGDTLQRAILPLEPPLWDIHHERLTLWLDPGRIKRDLNLHQRFGAPLQANHRYELVISSHFPSANGLELGRTHSKKFFVEAADRESPQLELGLPKAHSQELLQVVFSEEVDKFTTLDRIFLYKEGQLISDSFFQGPNGKTWLWRPEQKWENGRYEVRVSSMIEDYAGNNLNRLFDVDLWEKNGKENEEKEFLIIPFELR